MSDRRIVSAFAESELQARRLEQEAVQQAAEAGVAKSLRTVNKQLRVILEDAMLQRFDSIRFNMNGETLYLKRNAKKTAKACPVEALAHAWDSLTDGDLRKVQESAPDANPLDILVTCICRLLRDNSELFNESSQIILDKAPLKTKRVSDTTTDAIRVFDAPPLMIETARKQLELKAAQKQVNALTGPKRKRAREIREASQANVKSVMAVIEREEKRGVPIDHSDALSGRVVRVQTSIRSVKPPPITVTTLDKGGLLHQLLTKTVDVAVHGSAAPAYLQPEVRTALIGAYSAALQQHEKKNTTLKESVRVQTLPAVRQVQTGRPKARLKPAAKSAAAPPGAAPPKPSAKGVESVPKPPETSAKPLQKKRPADGSEARPAKQRVSEKG